MRILLIIDCFLPSTKSIAHMADELARQFRRRGNTVTVLVPSDELAAAVEVTGTPQLQVIRYKTGKIKGAALPVRAANEILLSLVALWRTRRLLSGHSYDLIVFYSPSIFFGPLVGVLKRRWHARAYLILRDIFPDWAVQTGVLKRGLVYRVFKLFERLQYAVADTIGVETSHSIDYFAPSAHRAKVELLRNWTEADLPEPAPTSWRERLGLAGKTVFFYGGNIGVAQDMDNIMRLARRMTAHPDVHFLLVGDGSEAGRLMTLIRDEPLANVTLLPPVDQDSYLAMLGEFDVGLISLDRRLKTFSNTGKMLGYMRCGLPILASYNPGNDLGELLHDREAGLGSLNGEDEVFYKNALRLRDPAFRRRLGENARRLLHEEFSVEQTASRILRAAGAFAPCPTVPSYIPIQ